MSITINGSGDINATGNDIELNSTGTTDVTLALGGGKVGIGTATPDSYYAKDLVIAAPDEGGITVVSDTTHSAYLMFADGTAGADRYRGQIFYDHNVDRLGIAANGSTRLLVDSDGLKFNGDTAAANALDDYEQGDFSPTWQQGITSPTLGAAEGYYTKVGNLVTFCMLIYANGGTANSSHMYIGGLPFTSSSVITPSGVILSYQNGFKTNLDLTFHIPRSGTTIQIYTPSTGNPFYGTDATNVLKYLYLNGFYYVD